MRKEATMSATQTTEQIVDVVREKYGEIAKVVQAGGRGCCGDACCGGGEADPITGNLYTDAETENLPEAAVLASRLWQPHGTDRPAGRGDGA
jgi:hypothetical protein